MDLIKFKYNNFLSSIDSNEYDKLFNSVSKNINIKNKIKSIPFLREVYNDQEIVKIKKLCETYNKFNNYCILGTGGSILGFQTLFGLNQVKKNKKFYFFYDIDPVFFEKKINNINLSETCFIIISKSGSTPETMGQFGAILKKFEDLNIMSLIEKNFVIITEKKDSPLRSIAKKFNIDSLIHDKDIGGRFSVFSNVALFPASLAGIDINIFKQGGRNYLENFLDNNFDDPYKGAVLFHLLYRLYKININVIFTYSDSLLNFGKWYCQLWAESLGKKGIGSTPVHSVGTFDQHSQLQLYLDGPKDKFFTCIKTDHLNKGPIMHESILNESGLNYIAGKRMGDLMEAEQNSTIETLINNKLFVREIMMKEINIESLGSLMMYFFIETIIAGEILGINIFNQPAVEDGKVLTKKILK
tara:strand:- start:5878 stop:7119 length:1242 start_codon:yes stop_codon:yes gene_type:complete